MCEHEQVTILESIFGYDEVLMWQALCTAEVQIPRNALLFPQVTPLQLPQSVDGAESWISRESLFAA